MVLMLAQAAQKASEPTVEMEILNFVWRQITSLSLLHALLAISVGLVYLMYGWRIFRVLVAICFGFIGLYVGIYAGKRFDSPIWGGVLGVVVLSALSLPLMKWCVSLLGAVAGAIVTGGIWYAVGLPSEYIWAGAVIGLVAGGLVSFILLRLSVMLFTTLGGSVMMMIGFLALVYLYQTQHLEQKPPQLQEVFFQQHWFLPMMIILPTLLGMMVQHRLIKQSAQWKIE